jgi:hypothetical protein
LNGGHYAKVEYPRCHNYGPTTQHSSLYTFISRKNYNFFTQRNAQQVMHLVLLDTTLEQCPKILKYAPLEPLKTFPFM